MLEEMFEWTCPRQECNKRITSFTENGMKAFRDSHIAQHVRQDLAVQATRIDPKPAPEKKLPEAPIVIKEQDYNILKLTVIDKGFMKTRGVKWDENCVIDYGE
jgi:hypothetical protein